MDEKDKEIERLKEKNKKLQNENRRLKNELKKNRPKEKPAEDVWKDYSDADRFCRNFG